MSKKNKGRLNIPLKGNKAQDRAKKRREWAFIIGGAIIGCGIGYLINQSSLVAPQIISPDRYNPETNWPTIIVSLGALAAMFPAGYYLGYKIDRSAGPGPAENKHIANKT